MGIAEPRSCRRDRWRRANRSAPASSDAAPAPAQRRICRQLREHAGHQLAGGGRFHRPVRTSRARAGIEGPAETRQPRPRHLHRQPYCRRKARPSRHPAAAPVLRPSSADRRRPGTAARRGQRQRRLRQPIDVAGHQAVRREHDDTATGASSRALSISCTRRSVASRRSEDILEGRPAGSGNRPQLDAGIGQRRQLRQRHRFDARAGA